MQIIEPGKVVSGLKCCTTHPNEYGDCMSDDCPYKGSTTCCTELMRDALALLKEQEHEALDMPKPDSDIGCWYDITHNYTLEQVVSALKAQEPVKPVLDIDTWKCGKCGHTLEHQELLGDNVLFHEQYNYCPQCGKAVKWNET